MKSFAAIAIATASLAQLSLGSQYVTVKDGESTNVEPTSLVEVTVIPGPSIGNYQCSWNYSGGGGGSVAWPNSNTATQQRNVRQFPLTNITRITASNSTLTLKITTAAELQETVSGMVVLPAITGQGYAVTLEHSTDLANWQPVAPGEFTGTATPQFFRVKMSQSPTP